MKRLLLAICALCSLCSLSWSQSVTVTGNVTDSSGNPATSGKVVFTITPISAGLGYTIIGTSILAPGSSTCGINNVGVLLNQTLAGPCLVWGNDQIAPANSLYTVAVYPNGKLVYNISNVLLTASSADLSSLTIVLPRPVVGTQLEANPIITMGFQPLVPAVFNIGNLQSPYASLYSTSANIKNYIDFFNVTSVQVPALGYCRVYNSTSLGMQGVNSAGGSCLTGGGGGGGSTIQVNGGLALGSPVNFQNSAGIAG